jgi:large subunit ribosomal protein L17
MASFAAIMLRHGRRETPSAKTKPPRRFVQKAVTMAKKLYYLTLTTACLKDGDAMTILFSMRASEFIQIHGAYSRIYQLGPRIGDAPKMAIVELVPGDEIGCPKSQKRNAAKRKKTTKSIKLKEQ